MEDQDKNVVEPAAGIPPTEASAGPPEPQPPAAQEVPGASEPVAVAPPEMSAAPTEARRGGMWWVVVLSVVLALAAGALGGFLVVQYLPAQSGSVRVLTGTTVEPVAAAAAAALPSVVFVDVSGNSSASGSGLPKGHPSVPVVSEGSGVAYRPAPGGGTYIVTNNHVIEGAKDVGVTLEGGKRVPATIIGGDADTDIAVIKVPVHIRTISLGNSEKLVVGQLVVAIGAPFGLAHSVSSGVVSALHRSLPDSSGNNATATYPLVDVIQTDAAINPGNSGGALVDRYGRLVGINSAIFSDTGQNSGIGFAIPEKTAVRVATELIAAGKAQHPFLGVLGETIDSVLAKQKKLPVDQGVLVAGLTPGSGAQAAGVRKNDIILSVGSTPIRSMDDLLLAVRRTTVGQKVTLTILRGGKRLQIQVTIKNKPPKL